MIPQLMNLHIILLNIQHEKKTKKFYSFFIHEYIQRFIFSMMYIYYYQLILEMNYNLHFDLM